MWPGQVAVGLSVWKCAGNSIVVRNGDARKTNLAALAAVSYKNDSAFYKLMRYRDFPHLKLQHTCVPVFDRVNSVVQILG